MPEPKFRLRMTVTTRGKDEPTDPIEEYLAGGEYSVGASLHEAFVIHMRVAESLGGGGNEGDGQEEVPPAAPPGPPEKKVIGPAETKPAAPKAAK